jgi:hypothetical protein
MSNKKHYVIVSTNEIDTYIEFVPSCYQIWKKNLDCIYVLGVVTDKDINHPLIKRLNNFCDELHIFKPLEGVHTGIQAKTIRMWMASLYSDNVCTLTDIDQYLFDFNWLMNNIKPAFDGDKFVGLGQNAYFNGPDDGKIPMYYITAKSYIFKKIINEYNYDNFNDWFNQFRIIKNPIDNKEQIGKDFNNFSDESLMRYLIVRHSDQVYINKVLLKIQRFDFNGRYFGLRLDRSFWPNNFDENILKNIKLIDCNPLRPFNKNYNKLLPIFKWLNLDLSEDKIKL